MYEGSDEGWMEFLLIINIRRDVDKIGLRKAKLKDS